jgi:hypothetical protein
MAKKKKRKKSGGGAKRVSAAARWLEKSRISFLRSQIALTRRELKKKWSDEIFARLGKLERELAAEAK